MLQAAEDTPRRQGARLRLVILLGCVAYVIALAYIPNLVAYSPLVCGSSRILGLSCPGCGLTRAFACLARLQPWEAVQFNPLILIAAPAAVVLLCDSILEVFSKPGVVQRIPRWLRNMANRLFIFAAIAIFVLRFMTWVVPTWNPDGWGLPPVFFPPP